MNRPAGAGSPSLLSSWIRTLRRTVSVHRRGVAALLAFVAVYGALRAVAAPETPGTPVVTVLADVPGGSALTRDQVTVRSVPAELVPRAAVVSLEAAVGRTPAGPLTGGSILTEAALVGPGLSGSAPGRVVVPARLADAGIAGVIRVGDAIDVMATDPGSGEVARVASRARVAAIPAPDGGSALVGTGPQDEVLVLLDVSRTESLDLTRAAATSRLSIVLPNA